jgi:ubiquitin-protein ligase
MRTRRLDAETRQWLKDDDLAKFYDLKQSDKPWVFEASVPSERWGLTTLKLIVPNEYPLVPPDCFVKDPLVRQTHTLVNQSTGQFHRDVLKEAGTVAYCLVHWVHEVATFLDDSTFIDDAAAKFPALQDEIKEQ